ncbi:MULTISPECIES: hypothetical protein [unclassified Xanthomonas]|uniref:hypothetical protein n=1 Tax=unclassified Xanthomonas TaxID=2643310 RepID=UPI002882F4FF|nr:MULTISPECIES: hypothetical protein [unclassified Xanthomonas]
MQKSLKKRPSATVPLAAILGLFCLFGASAAQAERHYIAIEAAQENWKVTAQLKAPDGRILYTWNAVRRGSQKVHWNFNYGGDNASLDLTIATQDGRSHTFGLHTANQNLCIEFVGHPAFPFSKSCD